MRALEQSINEFQVTMPYSFVSILSLIRETKGENMIMSAFSTSWTITPPPFIYESNDGAHSPTYVSGL